MGVVEGVAHFEAAQERALLLLVRVHPLQDVVQRRGGSHDVRALVLPRHSGDERQNGGVSCFMALHLCFTSSRFLVTILVSCFHRS